MKNYSSIVAKKVVEDYLSLGNGRFVVHADYDSLEDMLEDIDDSVYDGVLVRPVSAFVSAFVSYDCVIVRALARSTPGGALVEVFAEAKLAADERGRGEALKNLLDDWVAAHEAVPSAYARISALFEGTLVNS